MMKPPHIQTIMRGGRKLSCAIWKKSSSQPPVFCVHGLTRNGRDFDYLASHLSDSRSIYSPDVVGRGQSEHLPTGQIYDYDLYTEDALHLLDSLHLSQVDWVGTSMGGILGMKLAVEYPNRIHKFVVNDIGGVVSLDSMHLINNYVGRNMEHLSLAHAEHYLRSCYGSFGLTEDWQWEHLLKHSFKETPEGRYRLVYDPAIMNGVRDTEGNLTISEDIDLWPLWDNIPHPILLLRGESSEFLSAELAKEMCERNPNATLLEFNHCGHAPALMNEEQVSAVHKWLDE